MPMFPETIGRYKVKSVIGRGGMAAIYAAHDPVSSRDVAIKVLPPELLHDPKFRARFEREARTIAALEHPAILPVYDFGESGGQPYLVMRLMTGGSLADRIKNGPMSLDETIRITSIIADALDYAHAHGIIHRDLKPGNILFDQGGEPYLADFGIVKLTEATATLTGNVIVGTPAYMSPEQGRGEKDLDGRSDIYSLGVIVFEMLTGKLPYSAETPMAQIIKHMSAPIPLIRDYRQDLPEDIQIIINRAMHKRRFGRYATASELVQDLKAVRAGVKLTGDSVAGTYVTLSGVVKPQTDTAAADTKGQTTQISAKPARGKKQKVQRSKLRRRSRLISFFLVTLVLFFSATAIALQFIIYPETTFWLKYQVSYYAARLNPTQTATIAPLPTIAPSVTQPATLTPTQTLAPTQTQTLTPLPTLAVTETLIPTEAGPFVLPVSGGRDYPVSQEPLSLGNLDRLVKLSVQGDGLFYRVRFSPDGDLIAIGTSVGTRLLDADTLTLITLLPSQNPVISLSFSPDNRLLATTEFDRLVLWDWEKKKVERVLYAPDDGRVTFVEFAPDGQTIWGGEDNTYIWRVSDGSVITFIPNMAPDRISISIDSQYYAVPLENDVQIISLIDGSRISEFRAFNTRQVKILPDNDTVVAIADEIVRFFSVRLNKSLGSFGGRNVVISRDGETFVSDNMAALIQVWRISNSVVPGFPFRIISYFETGLGDYQVSENGEYLLHLLPWIRQYQAYDLLDEKQSWSGNISTRPQDGTYEPTAFSWFQRQLLFRPYESKTALIFWGKTNIEMFDITTNRTHQIYEANISLSQASLPFNFAQYKMEDGKVDRTSSDQQYRAVATTGRIDVTNMKDGSKVATIYAAVKLPDGDITFSRDLKFLAFISTGATVRVWNLETNKQVCVVNGTGASPFVADAKRLFFSDDNKILAIYHAANRLSYWSVSEGTICSPLDFYHVTPEEISPDGSFFVQYGDREIQLRDFRTGEIVRRLWGELDTIRSGYTYKVIYGFSDNGRLFTARFLDGTVHVWGIQP